MDTSTKNCDFRERTYRFSLRILRLVRALGSESAAQTVGRQLLRSGTSIGANVEEAHGSHSLADFARRMNIARMEARESLYWLRLARDGELVPAARLVGLLKEADEILRILVSTMKTLRKKKESSN